MPFAIYADEEVDRYVKLIEGEERSPGAGKEEEAAAVDPQPEQMEQDLDAEPEVAHQDG